MKNWNVSMSSIQIMSSKQDIDVALSSEASHSFTGEGNGCEASLLLEMAADDDLAGFREAIEDGARVDEPRKWYCRVIGTNKMASEQRTALMIASLYGSMDVLGFIFMKFPLSEALVNQACGSDMATALHCASAGASPQAMEIVKLLLDKGARWDAKDALDRRAVDVLVVNPTILNRKSLLKGMLSGWKIASVKIYDETSPGFFEKIDYGVPSTAAIVSISSSDSSSPLFSPVSSSAESSDDHFTSFCEGIEKEMDASDADIKNSMYSSDEFRMFSFKVRPCSRAYSHDWTECPFAHPGENARRRDPRRHHYSCVPCPDFRKGSCRIGDACEYAHGVFECWLHPAQYRTRLCKDAINCTRRVCFFAHTSDELRPLSSLEFRSMSPPLSPASPSMLIPSPFNASVQTPPLSPASSFNSSYGSAWSHPSIPVGGFNTSRLKASLNARDLPLEDLNPISDLDDVMVDFSSLCNYERINPAGGGAENGVGKSCNLGFSVSPSINLQGVFASEIVLPRSVDHHHNSLLDHRNASLQGFQLQSNSLLSPRSTQRFSQLQVFPISQSLLKSSAQTALKSLATPKPISSCRIDLDTLGPFSPDVAASLHNRKAAFLPGDRGSWSSKDLSGLVTSSIMSDWGSPSGKPDWGVQGSDLSKLRKSISFASIGKSEFDVFLDHSLVKDAQGSNSSGTSGGAFYKESVDGLPSAAWTEQVLHQDNMAVLNH